jgi:hypothetical protein
MLVTSYAVLCLAGIRHEIDFLVAEQCARFVVLRTIAADTDRTHDLGRLAQLNRSHEYLL